MTSLSTRFLGQPNEMKPTLGRAISGDVCGAFESVAAAKTSKGVGEVTTLSLSAFAGRRPSEPYAQDSGNFAGGRTSKAGRANRNP